MINWNEVVVGETEICRPSFTNRKVVGVFDDWVWLKDLSGYPCSYYKKDLIHWTIYDPWEDVSDHCKWVKIAGGSGQNFWVLKYKGSVVEHYDKNFKVDADGRRVWKRKEGS